MIFVTTTNITTLLLIHYMNRFVISHSNIFNWLFIYCQFWITEVQGAPREHTAKLLLSFQSTLILKLMGSEYDMLCPSSILYITVVCCVLSQSVISQSQYHLAVFVWSRVIHVFLCFYLHIYFHVSLKLSDSFVVHSTQS